MKKIVIFLLFTFSIIFYIACERDDICAESTQTTPSLIIDFYNVNNTSNKKVATNLIVTEINHSEILLDTSRTNTVTLPLDTNKNYTQYLLWKNYELDDDSILIDDSGNKDTITISYSRENVYISRACGFKTIYDHVTITIEDENDDSLWISNTQSVEANQSVENEDETHYFLFH